MTTTIKADEGYTFDVTAKAEKLAQLGEEVVAAGATKEMNVVMQNLNDMFITIMVKTGEGIYSVDVCTEDDKVLDVLVSNAASRQAYNNHKINTFMLSSLESSVYKGETLRLKLKNNSKEEAVIDVLVEQKKYATDNRLPVYSTLKVADVTAAMLKPAAESSALTTLEEEEEEKPVITYAELYKPKISNFVCSEGRLKADIKEGANCEFEIYDAVSDNLIDTDKCQNKFSKKLPRKGAYKVRFRTENNGVHTKWTKFRYAATASSLNNAGGEMDPKLVLVSWVGYTGATKYTVYVRGVYEGGKRSEWRVAGVTDKHTFSIENLDFYETMRYEIAVGCEVKLANGKTIKTKESALSPRLNVMYNPYMED